MSDEPAPTMRQLMGRARNLTVVGPSRRDHIPAFRIAIGLAGPLLVLLVTGRTEWAMYASFGAFTGIYSRYEPTRLRFQRQSFIGLLLSACVGIGALLAELGQHWAPGVLPVVSLVIGALVAGASATLITARGIKPGGAVFPVFAVTAVAAAPPVAPVWLALLIALVSAGWCVLLGLAGHYVGERHPDAEPPAPPPLSRRLLASEFCLYAGAALVAGIIGVLSGLPSPYWAQVAAVVPLSAPGRSAQLERGIHRVIGTSLGVVVTAFLLSFPVQPWQLVVWVVLLQFLAEMFVLRNYSLALLFITPLALLMVQLAHPQPAAPLLTARVVETAIGALVGMAAVGVAILLGRRRRAAEREPAPAPPDSDPGTAEPRAPRPSGPEQ